MMSEPKMSKKKLERFIKSMSDVLNRIESISDFEAWLKSQPFVTSVHTAEHLIKTEPPKKEVTITFEMENGSTVSKVVDVILFPDQSLGLADVHEP